MDISNINQSENSKYLEIDIYSIEFETELFKRVISEIEDSEKLKEIIVGVYKLLQVEKQISKKLAEHIGI